MNTLNRIPTIDDYLNVSAHPLRETGGCALNAKREYDSKCPFVTVITVVKNQKETLEQTIKSVLTQSYLNIEYIIVDGASTDGTLEIIKQFDDKINLWISEPDYGPSDAFNKAVSMAQGDFIFWLSSDDWIDPDFMEIVVQMLLKSSVDFVFGDMVMYKNEGKPLRYKGDRDYAESLMSGYAYLSTPTIVARRECYKKTGLQDIRYKLVADYEWIQRLHSSGAVGLYDSSIIVHRRSGGVGESNVIGSAIEHLKLLRQYGLPKAKAMTCYANYLVRGIIGRLTKFLLPDIIYKKLKRVVRGG
ncbi:MAG: glycosyltransferase family 2 protein [Candidatus Omnitrophota bacterium]